MEDKEEAEGFVIDNDAKCDWALEKIKKARLAIKENEDTANEILRIKEEEVKKWLKEENLNHEKSISYLSSLIRDYSIIKLDKINKNKKKPVKSFTLPSGKVAWKKKPDEYILEGRKCDSKNEKLIEIVPVEFIKEKTDRSVDWSNFKKTLNIVGGQVISANGEVLPIEIKIGEYELSL